MWDKVNRLLKGQIVTSVLYIVWGLCFLLVPISTVNLICKVAFGVVLILAGIYHIGIYALEKMNATLLDMMTGGMLLVIGVFLFYNPQIVVKLLPVLLGTFVLVDCVWVLKGSFRLKKAGRPEWSVLLIASLIFIGLGALLIFSPFRKLRYTVLTAGIIILANGVADVVFLVMLKRGLKAAGQDHAGDADRSEQEEKKEQLQNTSDRLEQKEEKERFQNTSDQAEQKEEKERFQDTSDQTEQQPKNADWAASGEKEGSSFRFRDLIDTVKGIRMEKTPEPEIQEEPEYALWSSRKKKSENADKVEKSQSATEAPSVNDGFGVEESPEQTESEITQESSGQTEQKEAPEIPEQAGSETISETDNSSWEYLKKAEANLSDREDENIFQTLFKKRKNDKITVNTAETTETETTGISDAAEAVNGADVETIGTKNPDADTSNTDV